MMGSGKTAVGRAVAERARLPFFELDDEVELRAGMSIARIFETQGEAAFRAMERAIVTEQLADPTPRVVAMGGGSLVGRSVRLQALERGFVVTLSTSVDELAKRLAGDRKRPMLAGAERETRVAELLEARASGYAEAHAVITTTGRPIDELAGEVLKAAELDAIAVPPVCVRTRWTSSPSVLARTCREHSKPFHRAASFTSPTTSSTAWSPRSSLRRWSLSRGDEGGVAHRRASQDAGLVEQILRTAIEAPSIAPLHAGVGGGVITTSLVWRQRSRHEGSLVAVPTTVLAMVDASVGGGGQNRGRPRAGQKRGWRLSSTLARDRRSSFSQTDPVRAVRSGLAEDVKTALIGDAALYRDLERPGRSLDLVGEAQIRS